jgi:hypothetical protein
LPASPPFVGERANRILIIRISASFGPSTVRANTEQSTRAVARPTSLWHQPDIAKNVGSVKAFLSELRRSKTVLFRFSGGLCISPINTLTMITTANSLGRERDAQDDHQWGIAFAGPPSTCLNGLTRR